MLKTILDGILKLKIAFPDFDDNSDSIGIEIPNGRQTGTPGSPPINNIEFDDMTDASNTAEIFKEGETYSFEFKKETIFYGFPYL